MLMPAIGFRRWHARLAAIVVCVLVAAVQVGVVAGPGARAAGLTPQQLAGQRVIYSYSGLVPPPVLLDAIRTGQAAGVIFFGENISSTAQIAGVIGQLRQAQAESPIQVPLLLMTDQEGGLVRRLPGDPVLSAKQVGQSANPVAAAIDAGIGAGRTLRGVGMNVNLAPVLDVYDTPGNFIDRYQRSFSNNPAVVAALGLAFTAAQQTTGVAATAKHFPGLGSAPSGQNTDTDPVMLPSSESTLHSVDEFPYPPAIFGRVKLVMLSWAIYPALDPDHPAGLSPKIVNQELRARNGFTGVTITDAIEAGALNSFGTTGQRATSAAAAGMDLILCSARDIGQGEAATTALANAYTNGQLDHAAFTAAVDRVTALRAGLF
ncbi:glycoside hydrolase family 3 N-terminal domain-containing protein [Nocardia sp. NPDC050175]|uniref:glycoside hydrolase family 3 N-terminal domain-containing protein n=1 Tax=Nocardia sp. NPDC050175 TaxID=3364317 RepID=UPI0037AD8B98